MHNYSKRYILIAMCIMTMLMLLFSFQLLSKEADHECTGEHCLVCQRIEQCKLSIKRLFEFIIAVFITTISCFLIWREYYSFSFRRIYLPLAIYKIRFNN